MEPYTFQDFEENQQESPQESTSFFNDYLDSLLSSQNYSNEEQLSEDYTSDSEEETDFIKNLRSYDEERMGDERLAYQTDLEERLNSLISELDDKLSFVKSKINDYSWYDDPDNQDYLLDMYDTRNTNVPFSYSPSSYSPTGLSATYKANIAKGESDNNYMAKNPQPGQTAFGKYQFTKSTRLDTYKNSPLLKSKYATSEDFENAFLGKSGQKEAEFAQETAMDEYTQRGESIHKNNPVAMALYHYAPKFAKLYMQGQLDLNKRPSDYGVGVGVKNPTFARFLKTHGF